MTTHTRIRPFNTKETYPEQNLDNDLCQAVVAGNTIYLRGQIGQDLETRESVLLGGEGGPAAVAGDPEASYLLERVTDPDEATCSLIKAVDLVGERWTFLVLREALAGAYRFSEFRARLGIAQRRIGRDGNRIDDHAAFEPLDRAYRVALLFDGEVAVEHADPA